MGDNRRRAAAEIIGVPDITRTVPIIRPATRMSMRPMIAILDGCDRRSLLNG